MKSAITLILLIILFQKSYTQTIRVAILDFENISGIAKYDGLGKAMSSMLISDIESNVSPKRLQLVERSQIQKILKEQNFQASGSVNKSTAVQAGKILGVNYLLVGDIYILNDQLIINARLTNTETGNIVFSKKQEGKAVAWLTLKTAVAKDLASSLSQPFTEPTIPDKEITVATISTFGNAIAAKDTGNINKAEELISVVKDFSPSFLYVEDLKKEIEELKNRVEKVEKKIESLESAFKNSENIYFNSPKTENQFLSNAIVDKRNGRYDKAIENYNNYFLFGSNYIDPYMDFIDVLNLSQFEKQRDLFKSSIIKNNTIISKIAYALLIKEPQDRYAYFEKLSSDYNDDYLIKYFLFKDAIFLEKLSTSSANEINCSKISFYTNMNNVLKKMLDDPKILSSFIDKIEIKKNIDEMIVYSNRWSILIEQYIKLSEKQGLGIGNITFNLKKMFDCSDEEIDNIIIRYYDLNDTDFKEKGLTGKYYRFYNNTLNVSEFMDFKSPNKFDWINLTYKLNSEWIYYILKDNIIGICNESVIDLIIISENEIKYIDGDQNYIYRKKI